MKIALINNRDQTTGVGRYAFALAKYLTDYVAVDHYLFNQDDYTLKFIDSQKISYSLKQLKKRISFDNFLINKTRLSKLILDWRLASFIPNEYSIYHFTGNTLTNLLYHWNIKGKKILTIHDLFYMTAPENIFEQIFSKRFLYNGTSKANVIIATSEYTKNEILIHFKNVKEECIEVIYEGVGKNFMPLEKDEFANLYHKYQIPQDCYLLLHISIRALRKNNKLLIKVLNELVNNRHFKNIRLIKIGSWDQASNYLIEKNQLDKYIIQLKNIPEEEMVKFYNLADVFVFPSYAEGFGFPALEAMASGTPVVASNRTAIPEIVGDAGILLDPDDVLGFSENIVDLLKNEKIAQHYRERGIKRAQMFSWETTARKTYEVYKKMRE